ncbi:MAG: hypothetical protein HY341_02080 [Candidatus Kerfeldbacteria bacterium]|nr:hypothetical protein [Candidatus Kerfeldbacteria bacterium]
MSGVSKLQLQLEYWFVTHKLEFRRWWNILFITFDVALTLYVLVTMALYLIWTARAIREVEVMATDVADFSVLQAQLRPQPVTALQVRAVASSDATIDLVAHVRNPDTRWTIRRLVYQFTVGGTALETQESYLLPGQEKYLTQANVSSTGAPGGVSFSTVSVSYERARPNRPLPMVDIQFSDIRFDQPQLSTGGRGMRVQATATNQGFFGFRTVQVRCVLFSDADPVAVAAVPVGEMRRGAAAPVTCSWLTNTPVTNVILEAETPVFDSANILPFEASPEPETPAGETDPAA